MIIVFRIFKRLTSSSAEPEKSRFATFNDVLNAIPRNPATGEVDNDKAIEKLVELGRKIEAIKFYRQIHGTDLVTAKDAIDAITHRLQNKPNR